MLTTPGSPTALGGLAGTAGRLPYVAVLPGAAPLDVGGLGVPTTAIHSTPVKWDPRTGPRKSMAAVPGPQLSQPSLHRGDWPQRAILWRERTSPGTGAMRLTNVRPYGVRERRTTPNSLERPSYFLDRPVGGAFRHISSVNCASARQRHR